MAYEVKNFPFRTNMHCMSVTNTETGKDCKFMVYVGQQDVSSLEIRSGSYTVKGKSVFIDSRSPTPGFPAKNEMSKAEVLAEFDGMAKAICASLDEAK